MKKAIVLLSGGLDSSTALYWARRRGYRCVGLAVLYGQRHSRELASARRIARAAGIPLKAIRIDLPWLKASSLVDRGKRLPDLPASRIGMGPIPSTYVPGRNLLFVSMALSLADATRADAVVIGANALDFSGYPDCRPEFYRAFRQAARFGTRRGATGKRIGILTPLIRMKKAGIIQLARRLKVPIELTWSCYAGGRRPCGRCDSCKLRSRGFREAGLEDPSI